MDAKVFLEVWESALRLADDEARARLRLRVIFLPELGSSPCPASAGSY